MIGTHIDPRQSKTNAHKSTYVCACSPTIKLELELDFLCINNCAYSMH